MFNVSDRTKRSPAPSLPGKNAQVPLRTSECVYSAMEDRLAPSKSAYVHTYFFGLKYRRSIFHIKVIFGNNYSNFANFCITIGPLDRAMLHLSRKILTHFRRKLHLGTFTNQATISLFSPKLLTFFRNSKWRPPPFWIFSLCEFGHSGVFVVWYLCSVPNLVQISLIVTEIDAHMFQTFIWWRHVN